MNDPVALRLRPYLDFLHEIGAEKVAHSDGTFLRHLVAVYSDLEKWEQPQVVCLAGLFHSIYGTEKFQRFSLPLEFRSRLQRLIGSEAEQLAYWNCAMERSSFDALVCNVASPPPRFEMIDRFTSEHVPVTGEQFDQLCMIQVCDWLEQVGRSQQWDYRRSAYRAMAERIGGVARDSYERVFAEEPASPVS